jgi:hypothetical protein
MDRGLKTTLDRSLLIDRLTNHIQDTAESARTHGNHDWSTSVLHLLSTDETLGGLHGNSTDGVLTQMLGNLEHESGSTLGDSHLQGVKDRGKGTIELYNTIN